MVLFIMLSVDICTFVSPLNLGREWWAKAWFKIWTKPAYSIKNRPLIRYNF